MAPHGPALEHFPSGDIPDEDGYGLAIRAPLGVHRLSMHRYPFVNREGEPLVPGSIVRGQIEWLYANAVRNDPTPYVAAVELRAAQERALKEGLRGGRKEGALYESPIKAWVASVDIRDVVGEHVALSKRGTAHCPWGDRHKHGDKHKSLQVYESTQRWWCFSEKIGGNAFDWLLRYEQTTPAELLARLRPHNDGTRSGH